MFFAALFCLQQEAKQYTENLIAELQNLNQNSTFSWVSLANRALNNLAQELRF